MCSCGGKRPPTPKSTAVLKCPDRAWDVKCILDIFCKGDAEDKEVVKKLPRLTVRNREPKEVHYKKFEGGTWVDGGFTSGGSASGTTISVNNDTKCADAATTFFHEVTHTDQPAAWPGSQKEYDAYIKTEQWRIKKGLPPFQPGFQKSVPDPAHPGQNKLVPDEAAIKKFVDTNYAYNPPTPVSGGPPPPRVVAISPDGSQVTLSDGTTRAPKEGDALRLPDTGGAVLETVDPSKWKCP